MNYQAKTKKELYNDLLGLQEKYAALLLLRQTECEDELKESSDFLNITQQLAKIGGWKWDILKQTMTWSDETYRIHGLVQNSDRSNSRELVQKSIDCYDPDDRPVIRKAFNRCSEEGVPYDLEFPLTTSDGRRIWIQTMANAVLENNKPVKVIGTIIDITDRKKAGHELQKKIERTTLLLDLFAQAPGLSDKELYNKALDIAVKITESKIGFFHQVSDNQEEIILTTWNDEALKRCTAAYENHYPLERAGNWAESVRLKKPVVYNNYNTSPQRKGLPEGHAPVGRIMSIPVIQGEKVRLIFGVGNKAEDYSDFDITQIQAVANELYKILEKRKIEKELQKSEDRWHFAVEGSNDGIWDWNILTDTTFYSNRYTAMIGYNADELGGDFNEWKKLVHPDDILELKKRLEAHFNGESEIYKAEFRMRSKDGVWKWIMGRGKILERTMDGKPSRMVGTHSDITEQKRTEAELQRQLEFRQLLMEISLNFINIPLENVEAAIRNSLARMSKSMKADRAYTFDFDSRTETCTNTFEWCEEGISPQIENLQNIHLSSDWIKTFRKGEIISIPDISKLPENEARAVLEPQEIKSLISVPIMDGNDFIGFIGFDFVKQHHTYTEFEQQLLLLFAEMLMNIYNRRRKESDLIRAKEKAEESDRLKTAFLANVSHEIRTPMNGILGFANLLKNPDLADVKHEKFIGIIEKSGERMLNIINDLISISKIESGQMDVSLSETNINDQLEFLLNFFQSEAKAKGLALSLNCQLPEDEAIITTDREKIYAIMTNLIKNALKFTQKGSVKFGYICTRDMLEFYVKDTGIGIPLNKQKAVFDRFVQADSNNSSGNEGSGLGLSISKAYAEMLGGKMWLESKPGQGASLFFSLPWHPKR